jgi:hypothetical protein
LLAPQSDPHERLNGVSSFFGGKNELTPFLIVGFWGLLLIGIWSARLFWVFVMLYFLDDLVQPEIQPMMILLFASAVALVIIGISVGLRRIMG